LISGKYLDLRQRKYTTGGKNCMGLIISFIICTLHQNIICVIKSMRMRYVGYIMFIGEIRTAYKIVIVKSLQIIGRPRCG
jgi:hypothetical protein